MSPRFPVFHRTRALRRLGLAACLLGSLPLLCGCANLPPSSSGSKTLSGKRISVTVRFSGNINPLYHYYFLINYDTTTTSSVTGNQSANGPIPVLGPLVINGSQTYGNGFATSAVGTGGFTDFVRFEGNQYRLLHVVGDPIQSNFVDEGQPVAFTLPTSSNPSVLHFEIDLAQLVVNSSGGSIDATQAVNQANQIQWLQVNMVATDVVPTNQTTIVAKQVDALGNTQAGQTGFLNLNVTDVRTYTNSDASGTAVEPSSNDVYTNSLGTPDPSLDITQDYTIAITKQQ